MLANRLVEPAPDLAHEHVRRLVTQPRARNKVRAYFLTLTRSGDRRCPRRFQSCRFNLTARRPTLRMCRPSRRRPALVYATRPMRFMRPLLVLSLVAVAGLTVIELRPSAEETDAPELSKVTDSELQTFIGVYSAMQLDHDLQIEQAVEPHHLTVDEFRQLERRVQAEQRLVDKVRQALLAQANSRPALASGAADTPIETPIPAPSPTRRPKRKR
jgi:hypothetical protein